MILSYDANLGRMEFSERTRVFDAKSEDLAREHARLSGFPASKITEVRTIIDPMTVRRHD